MADLPIQSHLSGTDLFLWSLLIGVVLALVTAVLAMALRNSGSRRPGLVGPAWVIGTLLTVFGWTALRNRTDLRWQVVAGLILVFAGAELASDVRHAHWNTLVNHAFLVPGAVLLGYGSGFDAPVWLPGLIVLGTVFLGPFVTEFDQRTSRLGLGPVLFALALFGLQLNLSQPDLVRVALGIALPLALLAIPFGLCRLGDSGAVVAVALFLWLIAQASNDRPVQTWMLAAALGLLITEPMGRRIEKAWRRKQILEKRPTGFKGIAHYLPTVGVQAAVILTQLAIVLYVCLYAGANLTPYLHTTVEQGLDIAQRDLLQEYARGYDVNIWTMILRLTPAVLLGVAVGRFGGLSRNLRYRPIGAPEHRSDQHRSHKHRSHSHHSHRPASRTHY